MKGFRKSENDLFICEECGRPCMDKNGLSHHIRNQHKSVSLKNYYDKWLKEDNDDKCKICENLTEFIRISSGYKTGCCRNHTELYAQNCRKQTCLTKYGVESVYQSKEFKIKNKQSRKEKYGNENFVNSEKGKQTRKEIYGNENYNNSQKNKETCLNRYGVENVFQSEKIKEKCKQKHLKNLGVENPMQNYEIFEKSQKHSYYVKQYKNTNINYRGLYELDFLEKNHDKYTDIQNGPTIRYKFDNKNLIYYPDFYIPSLNLIIEIKNSYLAKKDKEQIKAKENAVISLGFKYIMIIDKDYTEFIKLK
jgi:hypothetical protein